MKALATISLMAFCLGPGTAQAYAVFGRPDCGQWVKLQRQNDKTWLMGYLSGMNAIHDLGNQKPTDPLGGLESANQAFLWMDNWCQANPLKNVDEGAIDLFLELMRKKNQK